MATLLHIISCGNGYYEAMHRLQWACVYFPVFILRNTINFQITTYLNEVCFM